MSNKTLHTVEYDILHQSQFKKNLSGNQIEALLDYFLYSAISPLLQTIWFKNELALVINHMLRDLKFKISRINRNVAQSHILNAISALSKEEILSQLKQASLDRNIFRDILDEFLYKTKILMKDEETFFSSLNSLSYDSKSAEEISLLEEEFGLSRSFLVRISKEVKFWFDRYLEFRHLIIGKYLRFAYKYAKITKLNRPNADLQCFFKSLILAIGTALNKYTADKGTLTSYIQLWFKSTMVNPPYDFELGRPFKLSNYAKQRMIDTGRNPNAISTDSEEFPTIENQLESCFLNNKLEDLDFINYDLLKFLDSIEDPSIDLVKIVLNIPELNENFVNNK